MRPLMAAELVKLRTTRAVLVYPIVLVAITALGAAGQIGGADDVSRRSDTFQSDLFDVAHFAGILAIILGITSITAEFRHGTITPSFLVSPVRERLLAAKTAVSAAAGVALGVGATLAVAAVAVPWLGALDIPLGLGQADVWTHIARLVVAAGLWGAIGVAVGSIEHSQVGALVGALVWLLIAEPLVQAGLGVLDLDGAGRLLPGRVLDAVATASDDDALAFWPALGLAFAYLALLGGLGALRTRGRDVTG
jgi:ABC-2 type transport system permease protein